MTNIKENIANLNSLLRRTKNPNRKEQIKHIIDWYEARKIPLYKTAFRLVYGLSDIGKTKTNNIDDEYEKTKKKYMTAYPSTGRLARDRKRKMQNEEIKAIEVQVILYTESMIPIDPKTGLPDVAKEKAYEAAMKQEDKKHGRKYFKGLRQVHIGSHILKIPSLIEHRMLEFFNLHLQQLLTISENAKGREITDQERDDFLMK